MTDFSPHNPDDRKSEFIFWYFNEFVNSQLFRAMDNLRENNSWHQENSVGIHTNMVVSQYLLDTDNNYNFNTLVEGAFAAAFHDVGKPACKVQKNNNRSGWGTCFSFPGHEGHSARMWEDFAIDNFEMLNKRFNLSLHSIFNVSWMIQNHLPWAIKKPHKLDQLAMTVNKLNILDSFVALLWADQKGRISQDWYEKRIGVLEWISQFQRRCLDVDMSKIIHNAKAPVLFVPIGCSGSGKSTYAATISEQCSHYSLDSLRHRWYDEDDYENAYRMSVESNDFSSKARQEFKELVAKGENIYCDNTNLTRKTRAFYINEARQKGYMVVGIVFPISLNTVINRQVTRPDKTVPRDAVTQQYFRTAMPNYGEIDILLIAPPPDINIDHGKDEIN